MWEEHVESEPDAMSEEDGESDDEDSVRTLTDDEFCFRARNDSDDDADPAIEDEAGGEWTWGEDTIGENVPMPQTLLTDTTLRMLAKVPRGLSLQQLFFVVISWTAFASTSQRSNAESDAETDVETETGEAAVRDADMVWGNGEDMFNEWVTYTNQYIDAHR
ncbi:hypothetical protein CYMTET_25727 [Cymbomonas tetramitiformis]|uniref:Uncharacterized protein n=1 Tax=Cymbomonas tetramitiformis TaxID=36881 RepID=A0AAE0FTA5_9CHLO|nr:hypothetical protein CYMTET_25727 [Cymbomonas tetramitiformis]|eukprot:gene17721-21112_t